MIVAVIAVCAVVAAIVAGFVWFGVALRDSERRTGDARVDAQNKAGLLAIAAADVATYKALATRQQERADALDQELENVAADGDAAGARERVQARHARDTGGGSDATDSGDAEPVRDSGPDPGVASGPVGDRLLKPGE